MRLFWRLTLTLLLAAGEAQVVARDAVAEEAKDLRTTPAFLWGYGFGAKPRLPFVADVNHDGFADLVCVYPPGDAIIDVALNGRGVKSLGGRAALHGFGKNCLTAGVGELDGTPGADVVGVFGNGEVRVAHSFKDDKFPANDLWAKLLILPKEPTLAVTDFNGDKRNDVLIADRDGSLTLLLNPKSLHKPAPILTALPHRSCARLVAADLDGNGRTDVVWADARGNVWRAEIVVRRETSFCLSPRPLRVAAKDVAPPALAVGDGDGDGRADLLLGSQLFRFAQRGRADVVDLPEVHRQARNVVCSLGDMNGDRRADVVLFRRDDDRNTGSDILVCLTYRRNDPDPDSDGLHEWAEIALGTDPLRRDTDGDGLLDGWEANGINGLNLPDLGANPRHKDVFVYVQRFEDVSEDHVKREMQRVVEFYAHLPVDNVDGRRGIALHPIFLPPLSVKEHGNKSWWENGDKFLPKEHRAVCHWMQVTNSGGGQSAMMGVMGSCGAHGLYATFLHEFGHQLGLDHTGQWTPAWCPLYTSLMNYAYSYQLNGKASDIRYSTGEFAATVLNETHLSEKLPYPYEKVKFLEGPPYRYKLKADGDVTWIDWNRNGVFDTAPVRADINYGYSTSGGDRKFLGDTTIAAPFLCALNDKLFLFYVREGGTLVMRTYEGAEKWSDATDITTGVIGDPVAASDGKEIHLFYPVSDGIVYRHGVPPQWSEATLIPDTQGQSPSAVFYRGKVILFCHTDAKSEVTYRVIHREGESPAESDGRARFLPSHQFRRSVALPARSLGVISTVPPGATVDPLKDELLVGTAQDQDAQRPSRYQVRRFIWESDEKGLVQRSMEWVGGESGGERGSRRPVLIFETSPDVGPEGRLHYIVAGMISDQDPKACYYDCMTIADKTYNNGWLTKRYYDEWTQSASAPAACWFANDIVLASRWFGDAPAAKNNGLYVAHFGLGIQSEPMGDFDDVGFIGRYGLERSILWLGVMPKGG
ncbi:MAG: FG-GAP-like repeat-containing protein [Abditibacteriales bacterium]|nr:FG-GAP-like repeat-containing protein [Abditibacteriales bacterium]MDW8364747.1 FG-GAP-like repeat-containing protein [Abditibacteriales bacterium]